MNRWFITGTDTEIGKTWVACALARQRVALGRRVACMKPIASGCKRTAEGLRSEDALALMEAGNVSLRYEQVNPVALEPAIAPHIAAARAGIRIDASAIAGIADEIEADELIIEGVGGWCVPLADRLMLADLVRRMAADVVLVVGLRLGCLNHALLTADRIQQDGFRLHGWIANILEPAMPALEENLSTLGSLMPAKRLGTVGFGSRVVS